MISERRTLARVTGLQPLARQQRTGAHLPCLPYSGSAVACSPYAGVLYALVKPPPCPPERTRAATCGARGAAGRRVTVVARAIVTVTVKNGTILLSREVARFTINPGRFTKTYLHEEHPCV